MNKGVGGQKLSCDSAGRHKVVVSTKFGKDNQRLQISAAIVYELYNATHLRSILDLTIIMSRLSAYFRRLSIF